MTDDDRETGNSSIDRIPPERAQIPCCARLNTIPVSWCILPDGHDGVCASPPMRPIETESLGPDGRGPWSPGRRTTRRDRRDGNDG
jgi:hypothetical protein